MKIIDLYNKIANGEEVPKKIKYRGIIWYLEQGFSNRLPYYKNGYNTDDLLTGRERDYFSHSLNDEVEIIEDTPKEDILNYKYLLQQEINNENEILESRLESDTKLDIIKNYITSEEAIDNFKTIESRNEWLEVHDKILDIIDNYKLQKESGEIIEDTPEEDKKIEKISLDDYVEFTTSGDIQRIDYMFNNNTNTFVDKINEIIDKINGE